MFHVVFLRLRRKIAICGQDFTSVLPLSFCFSNNNKKNVMNRALLQTTKHRSQSNLLVSIETKSLYFARLMHFYDGRTRPLLHPRKVWLFSSWQLWTSLGKGIASVGCGERLTQVLLFLFVKVFLKLGSRNSFYRVVRNYRDFFYRNYRDIWSEFLGTKPDSIGINGICSSEKIGTFAKKP